MHHIGGPFGPADHVLGRPDYLYSSVSSHLESYKAHKSFVSKDNTILVTMDLVEALLG
jgi:hypothetical protein